MTWTYRQSTGEIEHNGMKHGRGHAGDGKWRNVPYGEIISSSGPLPQGRYGISSHFVADARHGKLSLKLVPNPHNRMFGRSQFFVSSGQGAPVGNPSAGCIILPAHVCVHILHSEDRALEVIA